MAANGVPVTGTCRVLKLARQPHCRWLERAVTDAEAERAARANALFDAHREDPEFGYRCLADEARSAGSAMADRTAWRICRDNRWWRVSGKKRGRNKKAGPPVHDDLVRRDFTASGPNRLWLTDITEQFVRALDRHRMAGSIGRVRAAGDNAVMESFFSLLKKNVLDRRTWATRQELRIAIVTWIDRTYQRRRRQASLGRLTPVEFETVMTTPALQAA
ncbi:IS3 family transposase [Streptomyces sp. NPDC002886]|uniref:IS3 family transposase n=1 Tax=Streptomyces sp. NPDC002886 TaxID=3364667 RepID=UPI00369C920D